MKKSYIFYSFLNFDIYKKENKKKEIFLHSFEKKSSFSGIPKIISI